MNDAQYAYLDGYVRALADRMRLTDWRIRVQRTPADDGNDAQVKDTEGQHDACLRVAEDFDELSADAQRRVIVHELIHVHTSRMVRAIEALEPYVGKVAIGNAIAYHSDSEEYAVDALAWVIAPLMPPCDLPPATAAPIKATKVGPK